MSNSAAAAGGGFRCTRKLTLAMSGGIIIVVIALTVGLCVGLSGDDNKVSTIDD